MRKLINQVRVLALAAALTAGFMSFGAAEAVARDGEIDPEGESFACLPEMATCFIMIDEDGQEPLHVYGILTRIPHQDRR